MKKLIVPLICFMTGLASAYIGISSYLQVSSDRSRIEKEIRKLKSILATPYAKPVSESDIKETQATNLESMVLLADSVVKSSEKNIDRTLVYEVIANWWDPGEREWLLRFIETHSYKDVIGFAKNPVQARKLIQLYQ